MKKAKATKVDEVFVVVPCTSVIASSSYEDAVAKALEECTISEEDMFILKVVKVDTVYIPFDPEPEIESTDLENLL